MDGLFDRAAFDEFCRKNSNSQSLIDKLKHEYLERVDVLSGLQRKREASLIENRRVKKRKFDPREGDRSARDDNFERLMEVYGPQRELVVHREGYMFKVANLDPQEACIRFARYMSSIPGQNPSSKVFWTDASGSGTSKGRLAVVWNGEGPQRWFGRPFRVSINKPIGMNSNFAELLAIAKALEMAFKQFSAEIDLPSTTPRSVVIFTDSQRGIERLQNFADPCFPDTDRFAIELSLGGIKKLHAVGVEVSILWVKAHYGIEGNELADDVASHGGVRRGIREFDNEHCRVCVSAIDKCDVY